MRSLYDQDTAASQTDSAEDDVREVDANVLGPESCQDLAKASNVVNWQFLDLRVLLGAGRREFKSLIPYPGWRKSLY